VYIKELTFSATGSEKFKKIAKQIRDLRAQYLADVKRKQAAKEVYVNEKVETIKDGQAPRLGGGKVQTWPTISGKKNFGNLEAYVNGFRYQSTGGEHLNVVYQNIRLAIMQPSFVPMSPSPPCGSFRSPNSDRPPTQFPRSGLASMGSPRSRCTSCLVGYL
jgi:nucleosome binding factor SPN SPT16 subunit